MNSQQLWQLTLIAAGGALGSVARYLLSRGIQSLSNIHFPVGTLAVNTLGCLTIGVLSGMFTNHWVMRPEYRLGLTVGVLGGFTTFSTFGLETYVLGSEGYLRLALANVAASCGLGLFGIWLGVRLAEGWFGS